MSWVLVDDHAGEDERLCDIGGLAAWYHTCAHGFCRRKEHLRKPEGKALDFVPEANALGLYGAYSTATAKACVVELLRVGLWLQVTGGYQLTDYAKRYGHDGSVVLPTVGDTGPPRGRQLGGMARVAGATRTSNGKFAGTSKPPATPVQLVQQATSKSPPAGPAKPELLAPAKPASRASDPVPDPETFTEKAAAKDLKASAREPASAQQEAAAAVDASLIQEEAEAIQADPSQAAEARPHTWPELLSVARAWHMLAGRSTPRLGEYQADADVRALVALLAAGWPPDELVALGAHVGSWLAVATPDGRPRTLAMVTPAVLRIAQEQLEREAQVAAEARDLVKATAASPADRAAGAS